MMLSRSIFCCALLGIDTVSMAAFASRPSLSDLENTMPATTPIQITQPTISAKDAQAIDHLIYQQMIQQAQKLNDPKEINAYLDLANQVQPQNGSTADNDFSHRIQFYVNKMNTLPEDQWTDTLFYELASMYDQLGQIDDEVAALTGLIKHFPSSAYAAEAHFRLAENAFSRDQYPQAAQEYQAVLAFGASKFYQHAQYFYGWSLFKSGQYEQAISPFQSVIQHLESSGQNAKDDPRSKQDSLVLQDSYRAMSTSFIQLGGVPALTNYYQNQPLTDSEENVYREVGLRYREQKQLLDTAKVYENFVDRHPQTASAAAFSHEVIGIYQEAGFAEDIVRAKNDYITRYAIDQAYFKSASIAEQAALRPLLKTQLDDLARHFDSIGQTQKSAADYLQAADLYQKQRALATDTIDQQRIEQRIAEAFYNGGEYEKARPYFEALAYKTPTENAAEMGYFALLCFQAHAKELIHQSTEVQLDWLDRERVSALRFVQTFPTDKSAAEVLLAMAGQYLDYKQSVMVAHLADEVMTLPNLAARETKTARILKANASFDQQLWADAEASYQQVLSLTNLNTDERTRYQNQLGASLYQQAETAKSEQLLDAALQRYQQAAEVSQDVALKAESSFQAAMLYGDTPKALPLLQDFYNRYADSPQAEGVPERILKLQEAAQDESGAVQTYLSIYHRDVISSDAEKQKNSMVALWLAAETERKIAANSAQELALYRQYLADPHAALAQSLEASERIYQAAILQKDDSVQQQELNRQVQFYQHDFSTAAEDLKPRLRFMMARSLALQSVSLQDQYRAITLTQPLNDSVARKQRALQKVIDSQTPILELKVSEFVPQSQFILGDSFNQFYQAVLQSPVPSGLSDADAEQYRITLEEQAQPLKEKAIAWHKANAALAVDAWDGWVAKSFDALATLSSGHYLRPIKQPDISANVDLMKIVAKINADAEKSLPDLDHLAVTKSDLAKQQLVEFYRGIALINLGKFKEASSAFTRSDALNTQLPTAARRAEATYLKGVVNELYLTDYPTALNAYLQYLALRPNDSAVQKVVNLLQQELHLTPTSFKAVADKEL